MLFVAKSDIYFLTRIFLCGLLLSTNAMASSPELNTATIETKPLIFASSEYLPHYGSELPKQGAVVEIVRRAMALRQLDIEVAFMPFARALYDTQQGQFAGVIAIWRTAEREQHFLFSNPIYANQIVLFKRAGEFEHLTHLTDVLNSEGTLGLVTGYAQNELLVKSRMRKVSVATDKQIFSMLALRRVDLVAADLQNGVHLINSLPPVLRKTPLVWLTPALESKPMYLAFPKNRPDSVFLKQQFDLGLQALIDSGEFAQILSELLPAP